MELLSAEASKMESWSPGTISNFAPPAPLPGPQRYLPAQVGEEDCIWIEFVAKAMRCQNFKNILFSPTLCCTHGNEWLIF